MSELLTEPRTLVGRWLLAMSRREPERREALRDQIHQTEGWTKSEVGVVEAAFEVGVQAYLGNRRQDRQIGQFIEEVEHSFPSINLLGLDTSTIVRAALNSTAGHVTGMSVQQRLSVYSVFFVGAVDRLKSPRSDACQLIKEGERIAIARGWLPAIAE